jgi:hypothetical protein
VCALYSSEVQWLHVCDVLSYITLSVCSTSWQLEMLMMMTMTMMAMILMVLIFLAILMILIILMILMVMVMLADYMVSVRLKPRTSTN